MKFNSSRLKRFKYNINIDFDEAFLLNEIIAQADNQILRSIRNITNKEIDYDLLEETFMLRDKIKKRPSSEKNKKKIDNLQTQINDILFIPEYITVVMDHPKHYEYIYKHGVVINGVMYKRFSCSSSQARVSTVVLCDVSIVQELNSRLNNDRKEIPIAPSKFNAYFGLAGSATKTVSSPNFVVVKDFTNQTTFRANYVTETAPNIDDEIDVRDVTLDMVRNDGMGLISPRQSALWANELGLDWVPSQWCVRQNFIKGMLCTFDFHDFCKKINNEQYVIETIYCDEFGNSIKVDLRDYDVIVTESQFKLWNAFNGVDEYVSNCNKNGLFWGVSQWTPKEPNDILTLNYQFIQTLKLNEKSVEKLCSQFVDWVGGVSCNNIYYTMLFLLGANVSETTVSNFLRGSDKNWIKALVVNPSVISDKYLRTKIHRFIKNKIHNGCLGSIIVNGNFQVLVSDPYALMQHVCGLPVTGLLEAGQHYSGYWNKKSVAHVDAMRSPLTYRSEHVILNFVKNDETEYWYKHCQQGIILNWFGHEVVNFGGADKILSH